MGRPKKKIILFLVEGRSDALALERPIQALLDGNEDNVEAQFLIAETDVTSDFRNNPGNIKEKINKFYFDPFFSANDFCYPKDIKEVVQICDLDGTFIPSEYCRQFTDRNDEEDQFVYLPPYICSKDPSTIIKRNQQKAENLRFLMTQQDIKVRSKTVPYSIYYFSTNIDHFLHNELNLLGRDKVNLAETFADKYDGNPEAFIEFFTRNEYVNMDLSYDESWDYVTRNCNSIERGTNLNILLNRLIAEIK